MHGQRHNRIFHLVAINQRTRRDAKPMELLGIYDPALKLGDTHKTVKWSVDRIKYWLGVGALPSKSVVKLLERVSSPLLFVRLLVLKSTFNIQGRCVTAGLQVSPEGFGSKIRHRIVKRRFFWNDFSYIVVLVVS